LKEVKSVLKILGLLAKQLHCNCSLLNKWYQSQVRSTITVSTNYEVEKFKSKNNLSLWQRRIKDLLIHQGHYKALLEKVKKPQKLDDD